MSVSLPPITFSKMHGLGNDFMVVDNRGGRHTFDTARVRRLSDRHTGVGFDQLLLVEDARSPDSDFTYRIFNADGAEVEHCGNGARCFARFVHERGLSTATRLRVDTSGGPIELERLDEDRVRVQMGVPRFAPADIPFVGEGEGPRHLIDVAGETYSIGVASIGNPHALLLVDDIDTAPVARLGPILEAHERFPNRANIGFGEIVSRQRMRLRVYERGVGETRACGSGACAAVAIAHRLGLVERVCDVELPGGRLGIEWPADTADIALSGPCSTVFEGQTRM